MNPAMNLVARVRAAFATPAARPGSPRSYGAAKLFDDYAAHRLFDALQRAPEVDTVLAAHGLSREALAKLESDDEIYAALETRRDACLNTPWRLEPGTGEPVDWLWAELEAALPPLLACAWGAVKAGYSVAEVIYAPRQDGRIGLARIAERPLGRFDPRDDGSLVYTPEHGAAEAVDTRFKFLLTTHCATAHNPRGEALLSRLYWPWFFRHNLWRFWMQYAERFADPLLMGKSRDPQAFLDGLLALGFSNAIAVSEDGDITAATPTAAGEFPTIHDTLGRNIQKLILGQTLTSEVKGGSLAAAEVHDSVRDDKRRSDLARVMGTGQRLVDALWALNGFAGDAPRFVMSDARGLEAERAERDKLLYDASGGRLAFSEDYLMRVYDFEPGEVALSAPPAPAVPGSFAALAAPLEFSPGRAQKFTPGQRIAEDLAETALARAGQPVPAAAIRRVIDAATSPEDLAERLGTLLAELPPNAFDDALERALFAADVLGWHNAERGRY